MKSNVFKLSPAALPEHALDVSHLTGSQQHPDPAPVTLDLTGKRKVLLVIGLGGSGKTSLLRWIGDKTTGELALAPTTSGLATASPPLNTEPARRHLAMATCDPVNRSLCDYFDGVHSPQGDTVDWLALFLSWLMDADCSGAIDLGGGDVALPTLVASTPGIAEALESKGLHPVLVSVLTPRLDSLKPFVALGDFRPAATLFVLNTVGLTDPVRAFTQVRTHSVYTAAIACGAAEAWMPINHAAGSVEARRLGFETATTEAGGLNGFDRMRVAAWLGGMDREFAQVKSWLP